MSNWGDKIIQRFRRQLSGEEPMTQAGRRCARCDKDMSDYAIMFDPKPTDVCEECDTELRDEADMKQWEESLPPVYDIDVILGGPERKAYEIVNDLYRIFLSTLCADAKLFEPEVVIRDFCKYRSFSGDDLGGVLGGSQGDEVLLHGLRAMRAIGAKETARYMETFMNVAEQHGVTFPDPLPEPWLRHVRIGYELQTLLDEESRRLFQEIEPYREYLGQFGPNGLDGMLVVYVRANADLLRKRRPAGMELSVAG